MQPSVCFIFTSYLITLQPTPLKPLNLFRKSIPERQHRLLSLRQPELCWRQRPLRIITRLPWFPADASSAGGCQQMLLGFSFPLCCERRAHLLPPSIPLQAGRLAESCFARARQVSLRQLEIILDMDFFFFFFLTPASFIDSNTTFVKTTELNLSTFCAPATLAGITVKSFCTSSLEGHMRISPEKKQNYLLLPDKFPCDKGCSQFHQLGPNLLNSANFLSAKNLFRLQSERGNSRCPC